MIDPVTAKTWLHNSGMSVLLILLVAIVFVIPVIAPGVSNTKLLWDILLTLILVSGVAAVAEHRRLAVALALLCRGRDRAGGERSAGAGMAGAGAPLAGDDGRLPVAGVRRGNQRLRVRSRQSATVSSARSCCTCCWASSGRSRISIVERLLPGAFAGHTDESGGLADWAYFSFVTLTTVGYGDITPVALGARSLSMLEALVGQLYPAVIIARLVSLQVGSK